MSSRTPAGNALSEYPNRKLLGRVASEIQGLSQLIGNEDKIQWGRAIVGNLDHLVVVALNRTRTWNARSGDEEYETHDPDVMAAVRCYELAHRVYLEVPPEEPMGDAEVWRRILRKAVEQPWARQMMVEALGEE